MAIMEISIIPLGTATTSLSSYVANIHKVLKQKKVNFTLNDMGTTVEGETKDLLDLARELHELPFNYGVKRVYTVIKLDDRRDKKARIGDKVNSVLNKL